MNKRNAHLEHNKVFKDNVEWLLHSGIRIRNGPKKGALYGWKNLNPPSYPFIYNEITGYAITSFLYIYSELGEPEALEAAKDSGNWIVKNIRSSSSSYLLPEGSIETHNFNQKGDLSNQIYAFDNGMIIIGLVNLYKVINDTSLLKYAEKMAKSLIERFFDGSKLIAVLDRLYRPITNSTNLNDGGDDIKWSTISGAYHCKLSLALLDLSVLTNNDMYSKVSNSLCEFAQKLQKADGRFVTNPNLETVTYLHPHLYACEGLIYAGVRQHNDSYFAAGLKGIRWAAKQINSLTGGLPRMIGGKFIEQSDCMAQLLRLLILYYFRIEESIEEPSHNLKDVIEKLHFRLLDFYISEGADRGAIKYHISLDTACSWCTMFTMQALLLWNKRKEYQKIQKCIDYFI
jgi:hypothetical protein